MRITVLGACVVLLMVLNCTPSERRIRLENSSVWTTATFELTDATFSGRENGGADFRIIASKPKVFIRRVRLYRE
jgi:hypothetical protein